MGKIVVIGSLNMDLVIDVDELPKKGETIIGKEFIQIPGGKGANQAVAMGRLKGQVSMVGKIGEDSFGDSLIYSLKNSGVNTDFIMKANTSTGIALITVDRKGENTIVVSPGANYLLDKAYIDEAEGVIQSCDIVVTQLEIPMDTVEYVLKKAKSMGKYTILDPAPGRILPEEIIENVDLLTPNERELEILSGMDIEDEEDIMKASRKLMDLGAKELIITLGEKGAIHINLDGVEKYEAYCVKAVDTTGAGDSFNAGITVALSQGKSIKESIPFAQKVAALTVTRKGAQSSFPYLDEI